MLSESWDEHRHDPNRRMNLFRDLSRIMLSLAKLTLPRIGSWTIDNRGILSLTNRPLTFLLHQLENNQIPTDIPRDLTYTSVEPYFLDLIACQDNRLRHQPNAIHDKADGEDQLASLTAMRALLPKFTDRNLRHGPFITTLTDFHQSNIFVDSNWHITCLIDLEWSCIRPIEMLNPPSWISNRHVDGIIDTHLADYTAAHREFMNAFEHEEQRALHSSDSFYTRILWKGWDTGRFWYAQALDCPSALYALFLCHIQPRFVDDEGDNTDQFSRVMMPYWDLDAEGFIERKVEEQRLYHDRVREMFGAASLQGGDGKGEDE